MPAKTPKTETPEIFSDVLKSMQSAASFNPMIRPQIEQFWNAQEKMLDEAEAFARHWFERRHEASRTALETARTATSAERADPSAALQAMTDWQRHSVERMVEDAREWFDMMSRCANYVSETETEAVEEALDEASKLAKKATKSVRSEPV